MNEAICKQDRKDRKKDEIRSAASAFSGGPVCIPVASLVKCSLRLLREAVILPWEVQKFCWSIAIHYQEEKSPSRLKLFFFIMAHWP